MKRISDFLEAMQHEFPEHVDIVIKKTGYKVDDTRGIKTALKLDSYKSVDYFHECDNDGLKFIEFSDLDRQNSQLNETANQVKQSNLRKDVKRSVLKQIYSQINKELASKYKDSLFIWLRAVEVLSDIPEGLKESTKGMFCIIVVPDESLDYVDRTRFLDQVKSNLSSALPRDNFTRVKVIPLDVFVQ